MRAIAPPASLRQASQLTGDPGRLRVAFATSAYIRDKRPGDELIC